ncbi:hypothetical protein H6B13_14250 [Bacteroides gallinaceum]|uniref:hypothetical protein n=1 Tax=Bacteroides gallinaceum TaxID=1462571 RepID=UPI001956BC34|nr:hypothetical protein [Bacteroides gallinaceum]MBM6720778.1 hypothetical protein [Bacteroides gallinaceum]
MTTDKGLKKALGKQSSYRLPSNFTYRMMQQVREEAFARERREEHRLWWALAVFCLCTFCGVTYYVVKLYGASIVRWWHSLSFALPSVDAVLFFLPTLVALLCLGRLYWWLEKKMQSN